MTASEVKALIAALVLVGGAAAGAVAWHRTHPDAPVVASLLDQLPAALKPNSPAPARASATPVPAVAKPPSAATPPHFDIVRVEPSGEAVLAGKGDPNAKVELLTDGKVVARTTADPGGHFVILPPSLPPGSSALTLRQTSDGKPAVASRQSVTVSVPARGQGKVVVAMGEAGQLAPAAALAVAAAQPAPTPEPKTTPVSPGLAVRPVVTGNGKGFFVSGSAAPGTRVQIDLNGSRLAQVVAGADGQWSMTLKKGLTAGHYALRAEAIGGHDQATAHVEAPFDVPVVVAEAPVAPGPEAFPPDTAAASASGAHAVIDQIETALVIPGDNLWDISRSRLGEGKRFTEVYAANATRIHDPNLIFPGQVFVVPTK